MDFWRKERRREEGKGEGGREREREGGRERGRGEKEGREGEERLGGGRLSVKARFSCILVNFTCRFEDSPSVPERSYEQS